MYSHFKVVLPNILGAVVCGVVLKVQGNRISLTAPQTTSPEMITQSTL